MNREKPFDHDRDLDSEIDPVTCVVFVVIVFLIVPFTLLSPFQYPRTSTLDKLMSVNATQPAPRSETRLSGYRILDLSIAANTEPATNSVTR